MYDYDTFNVADGIIIYNYDTFNVVDGINMYNYDTFNVVDGINMYNYYIIYVVDGLFTSILKFFLKLIITELVRTLFLIFSIHQNSHWAIIYQSNFHIGSKSSGLHFFS